MNLKVHEKILRDALGNGTIMSLQTLSWLIRANKLCDLHQFAPDKQLAILRERCNSKNGKDKIVKIHPYSITGKKTFSPGWEEVFSKVLSDKQLHNIVVRIADVELHDTVASRARSSDNSNVAGLQVSHCLL